MKKGIINSCSAVGLLIALLMSSSISRAQELVGSWHGELDVQGHKVPLVFHFKQEEGQWKGTMDSPSQGAFDIQINEVAATDSGLVFSIAAAGIRYEGSFADADRIRGLFFQGSMRFDLELYRANEATETAGLVRPQEPKPPFPYLTENVIFPHAEAGIHLAGTLTVPEGQGPWPAVVLLAGSGPNDRDQHIFGHKTLLVVSDYLTRNGIATLRYDKRGVAESEGHHALATSQDFANDAQAAWNYLRQRAEVDASKVGLIGHSEGGIIAPMVAARQPEVAFLALLAAPGIRIDSLMAIQTYLIGKTAGMSEAQLADATEVNRQIYRLLKTTPDNEVLHAALQRLLWQHAEDSNVPSDQIELWLSRQIQQLTSPWFRYFINYDPQPALSVVTVPTLAINGDKDLQVTACENLEGIRKALEEAGNQEVTIKALSGLNHLFQESQTGAMTEYALIEQTISPAVLQLLSNWIKEQALR